MTTTHRTQLEASHEVITNRLVATTKQVTITKMTKIRHSSGENYKKSVE